MTLPPSTALQRPLLHGGNVVAQHIHPYCTPTAALQRYETCARLACGRHTTVYLARDMQADGGLVAIKVFQQAHCMPQVRQRKSERTRYALRRRLGSPLRGVRRGVGALSMCLLDSARNPELHLAAITQGGCGSVQQ